ncbi:MAG TPA: hypothetical protein GX699_03140 [Firmicutes bacterium]|nr:hypothetical protein [Bacillota bacterium]
MNILLLPVSLPVVAALLALIVPARARRVLLAATLAIIFLFSIWLLAGGGGSEPFTLLATVFAQESGINFLSFALQPVGRIALFAFTLALSLGLLFGLQTASATEQAISLLALAAASGIALADNFLTFLFFWELLTVSSVLLIYLKGTTHAVRMAYRVFFLQLLGGLSLTVGIILHYHVSGSFALTAPAAGLPFFLFGIGMKAAFLPFCVWVFWGYPAASHTASVLLAALCTKAGVYGLARILPPSDFLAMMGALMAIIAVSYALLQHNLRRLLSVHIVSQVGYMVAGIGLGAHGGLDGALLHMVNNMLYKSLLFMCAGAVLQATGTEDLHRLSSPPEEESGIPLWRKMPLVFAGALVGALAIAGTPLFNGYVSKHLIKHAAHGIQPVEFFLLAASVGTALSFMKFIWFGFIRGRARVIQRPAPAMLLAILITAAGCLCFGVYPQAAAGLLPQHTSLHVYDTTGVLMALLLIGIALILFILGKDVLIRGIHAPEWVTAAVRRSGRILKAVGVGIVYTVQATVGGVQNLLRRLATFFYRIYFRLFQQVDYRPGKSEFFHFVNFTNLDFDILLVLVIFGSLAIWNMIATIEVKIIYTSPF